MNQFEEAKAHQQKLLDIIAVGKASPETIEFLERLERENRAHNEARLYFAEFISFVHAAFVRPLKRQQNPKKGQRSR